MYESNRMIEIGFIAKCYSKLDFGSEENIQTEEIKSYQQFVFFDDIFHNAYDGWELTIVWINQVIPTYSIGDKVLILSTGETAEVSMVVYDQFEGEEEKHGVYVIIWGTIKYYHRSQIAKLPNDLWETYFTAGKATFTKEDIERPSHIEDDWTIVFIDWPRR